MTYTFCCCYLDNFVYFSTRHICSVVWACFAIRLKWWEGRDRSHIRNSPTERREIYPFIDCTLLSQVHQDWLQKATRPNPAITHLVSGFPVGSFYFFQNVTRPRAETQRAVKMSMGTCRGRLNNLAAFSSGMPFYIANDQGAHMFKPIPPYHHAIEGGGILEKPEGSNAFSGGRSLYVIQKTKITFPSTENNLNLHYLRVN